MPRGVANTSKRASSGTAMRHVAIVVISLLVASLAAVGASVADPGSAQAAGGGYVKKCGGGNIFLQENEKKIFILHNRKRSQHELKPFCVHPNLQKAARAHSEDMIRRDYFSHDTKGRNEGACERIRRYGYRWQTCGENIAYGSGSYGSPDNIFENWMKSSGHKANILNKNFREIGIGAHTGTYKSYTGTTMYTVDFGSPKS